MKYPTPTQVPHNTHACAGFCQKSFSPNNLYWSGFDQEDQESWLAFRCTDCINLKKMVTHGLTLDLYLTTCQVPSCDKKPIENSTRCKQHATKHYEIIFGEKDKAKTIGHIYKSNTPGFPTNTTSRSKNPSPKKNFT